MKTLSHHLDDYLQLRRQLGYKMQEAGFLLRNFVRFAEQKGAGVIRAKLALQWAAQPNIKPAQSGSRLGVVRRFAEYLSAYDARTEVPPQKLLPYHFCRRDPYHYTDENVCQLVNAAWQINPASQIKGPTFGTVLGLLAVTGMRVGEALALDDGDVDFDRTLLTIRLAKGGKSRVIPLHASTISALHHYASIRDSIYPQRPSMAFFVWDGGDRLVYDSVNRWFLLVACQIGLRKPGDQHGPRVHDLRHYFAIRTLLNWYQADADVEARLPELSTYLGHVHVRDSYWYLSAVPELLQLATLRLERAEKGVA
ncbi:MAG TPA: tyrosine-type recombinase/integrase [Verrucomicrobiae bacterium]|jgi:integrase/recombinase XerD|nr:tyrosine-type recombinase/integrase [Verrucomicrobiae bacterium]